MKIRKASCMYMIHIQTTPSDVHAFFHQGVSFNRTYLTKQKEYHLGANYVQFHKTENKKNNRFNNSVGGQTTRKFQLDWIWLLTEKPLFRNAQFVYLLAIFLIEIQHRLFLQIACCSPGATDSLFGV